MKKLLSVISTSSPYTPNLKSIGGKNKTTKQIENIKDSFLVIDDIEAGIFNKIPLCLFGFVYETY